MTFTIRLTDEERYLAERYASHWGLSLKESFKKALLEQIEDEYDAKVAEEAYRASGQKSRPITDLWDELEI